MSFPKRFCCVVALIGLTALVAACGGGGGGTSASSDVPSLTVLPIPAVQGNVLGVTVDSGPANSGTNVNRLYTTVSICQPGSVTQCQTIDHVLVDTGSSGLRLLSSVMAPALSLSRVTGTGGLPLLNCEQFVDGTFAWGPVTRADIVLGSKTASNVPIQVIADPAFSSLAQACSRSGVSLTSITTIGANGILGLGLFKQDCGVGCISNTHNGFYYTCTNVNCTATQGATASIAQQLKNPVPLFSADNNGVLIDLPAVSSASASVLNGSLIFGIGTQSNNQLKFATVLAANANGYITTRLGVQSLTRSFIDSGSNGLFFDSATIQSCGSNATGFYCPNSTTTLSATMVDINAVSTSVFSFSVENASTLFAGGINAVTPNLSGPAGDSTSFDWGLPFFYGRRVFFGIEGMSPSLATDGFYAF